MHWKTVLLLSVTWRILIAVCTRTFFQPDEFFQSLEVAHKAVFGYGHLTWEWRVEAPIRSILFPSLYIPAYWLAKALRLDDGPALILFPKILQGLLASLSDLGTFVLARRVVGDRYAPAALFLSLTSFFNMLSLSRTLSNSVETSMTTLALYCWPWTGRPSIQQLYKTFTFAALSCMMRPTSAISWTFLVGMQVWRFRGNFGFLGDLFLVIASVGCASCLVVLLADSVYYGKWVFTPLNFLLTNLSSVSLFYGRCPWHYYLSQGLPIVLTTSLPFFLAGAWKGLTSGSNAVQQLVYFILWTTFVFSLAGHKEWRFLHPLLPAMLVIASRALVDTDDKSERNNTSSAPRSSRVIRAKHIVIVTLGVLPGIYTMFYHSRAQISVLRYLRALDASTVKSIGFLMPCHSTPWQSHLHRPHLASPGIMWSLGCEPPLRGQNLTEYRDQTDIFYEAPLKYLLERFPETVMESFPHSPYPSTTPGPSTVTGWVHSWPSHLVFFGALLQDNEGVEDLFRNLGYVGVWSESNGWEEDPRRRGGVRVWVRGGNQ